MGSVLGSLLFLIYINDIDEVVTSGLFKFADDAEIFRVVASLDDVRKLQGDLNHLFRWFRDWLMLSNVEKMQSDAYWIQ
jgi:ribonucleases P/MRP protein subunit RPP40